jgi:hypothetical protein
MMRPRLWFRPIIVVCALAFAGSDAAAQQPPKLDAQALDQLVGSGRLWAAVKYFHPYLVSILSAAPSTGTER